MKIPPRRRPPGVRPPVEEAREHEARDEAPYVGPERDATRFPGGAQGAEPAQELNQEPYEYEYRGRDVDELYEEENRHERKDF